MDPSFAYLFRGLDDGQTKKIEAIGKEMSMKKGQRRSSGKARKPTAFT